MMTTEEQFEDSVWNERLMGFEEEFDQSIADKEQVLLEADLMDSMETPSKFQRMLTRTQPVEPWLADMVETFGVVAI